MLNRNISIATVVCVALATIRHNGTDYKEGDLVTLNSNDKFFLEKAGYVRTATDHEIATAKAQQAELEKANTVTAPVAEQLPTDKPQLADQTVTHPEQSAPATVETPAPAETAAPVTEPQATPVTPVAPVETAVTIDYNKLKKAELNAELDKRGIAHDSDATNAELAALLVANDQAKAAKTVETGAN